LLKLTPRSATGWPWYVKLEPETARNAPAPWLAVCSGGDPRVGLLLDWQDDSAARPATTTNILAAALGNIGLAPPSGHAIR
jgi:hypothetical protein